MRQLSIPRSCRLPHPPALAPPVLICQRAPPPLETGAKTGRHRPLCALISGMPPAAVPVHVRAMLGEYMAIWPRARLLPHPACMIPTAGHDHLSPHARRGPWRQVHRSCVSPVQHVWHARCARAYQRGVLRLSPCLRVLAAAPKGLGARAAVPQPLRTHVATPSAARPHPLG